MKKSQEHRLEHVASYLGLDDDLLEQDEKRWDTPGADVRDKLCHGLTALKYTMEEQLREDVSRRGRWAI